MTDQTTPEHTRPSDTTRTEEARQAQAGHDAGPMPTPEEEQAADRNSVSPSAAAANKEAMERGAAQKGEGRAG